MLEHLVAFCSLPGRLICSKLAWGRQNRQGRARGRGCESLSRELPGAKEVGCRIAVSLSLHPSCLSWDNGGVGGKPSVSKPGTRNSLSIHFLWPVKSPPECHSGLPPFPFLSHRAQCLSPECLQQHPSWTPCFLSALLEPILQIAASQVFEKCTSDSSQNPLEASLCL